MLRGARSLPKSRAATMLPSLDSVNSALKSFEPLCGSRVTIGEAGTAYVAACEVQPMAVENDGSGWCWG